MGEEERAIQVQQLANIVIDAYLERHKQFVPDFGDYKGIMYLSRPDGDHDHPNLRTNVWYKQSDYESTVTPRDEEAKRSSEK
jgi:hypothetical protein